MESTISSQYSRVAVILHWLLALFIAANFIIAWVADDFPKAERMQMMGIHKAIGLTVLALTVIRIIWRLMHKPPPLSSALAAWEVALARVTHFLFYVLLLAIPLTGWGMASGHGQPISWFGLFNVPALPVGSSKAVGGVFHESHELLGIVMLVLLGLHVLGALKHQFLDHDDTMARMLPHLRGR